MKKKFLPLFAALALLLPATSYLLLPPMAAVLAGCTSGCASGKGTYDPKTGQYDTNAVADKVVVAAQKTRSIALGVFDLFLAAERQNEAELAKVSPAIHATAEEIRANGKMWIDDLTRLIAAYQSNRTVSNEINLRQALATIQSAIASAQEALTHTPLERK